MPDHLAVQYAELQQDYAVLCLRHEVLRSMAQVAVTTLEVAANSPDASRDKRDTWLEVATKLNYLLKD